jgi:hypothetical protein
MDDEFAAEIVWRDVNHYPTHDYGDEVSDEVMNYLLKRSISAIVEEEEEQETQIVEISMQSRRLDEEQRIMQAFFKRTIQSQRTSDLIKEIEIYEDEDYEFDLDDDDEEIKNKSKEHKSASSWEDKCYGKSKGVQPPIKPREYIYYNGGPNDERIMFGQGKLANQ